MSHRERVLATGCDRRDGANFSVRLEQFEDHRERGPFRRLICRTPAGIMAMVAEEERRMISKRGSCCAEVGGGERLSFGLQNGDGK